MPITHINLETGATTELAHDAPKPTAANTIVWLDVSTPTEDDLNWLARTYNFHPLAIEDCRHFEQRAKVDAFEGYLFLSVDAVTRHDGELHAHEMETFLGSDYLITVHRDPIAALDTMRTRCIADNRTGAYRPDFLFYVIVDQMVDAIFPLLDGMEDEIDDLEDQVLDKATRETLHHLFVLKRQLVDLRKIVGPMRDAMDVLADTRYEIIDPRTALYFRDVYDHLVRIYDLIETSRDLLSGALDAYLSTVSNRLSDIMKRLTLFTTIFMPISFLVGFGGMNFVQLIPFDSPIAFGIMLLLIALFPTVMLIYYRRSGWI
jgi:magnesium transporter